MTWRKFLFETLFLLLLTFGGFLAVSLICDWQTTRHDFKINELESNLFFIKENQKFDLTILGISHARNFSRQANHQITEAILNKKIMNLGRGNALCGMRGQQLYLDFFLEKGNQTDQVLFVASPPLMYGTYLDSVDIAFWDEPIRADFISFYLKNEGTSGLKKMFYHFRNKLRPSWLKLEKYPFGEKEDQLEKSNTETIEEGLKLAYPHGRTPEMLAQNLAFFKKIVEKCAAEKTELIVIIPPAIFGKWEGHNELWQALSELKNKNDFELHDFSESVKNPTLYYDHHHLNSDGIRFFLNEKFRPILK